MPPSRLSSARTPGEGRWSSSTATTVSTRLRRGWRPAWCSCPRRTESGSPAFGDAESRTPLWLADKLSVVRTPETLLAVAGDSAGRYAGLMGPAVRQVRRVLPSWRGPLLVEVPSSGKQLDSALQAEPGEYANIAAVTTTVDGSLSSDAPGACLREPDRLRQAQGARCAGGDEPRGDPRRDRGHLRHHADLAAGGLRGLRRPGRRRSPVELAARQILDRIRKEGLPRRLPTTADLDPSANGLGATYEEAWLACRFIAQKYGADRLLAVLPRGERRRLDARGVPQRAGHDAADVRGAVARGPRSPCRGGTLRA